MAFGRPDPHVPADGRRKIYDALTAAGCGSPGTRSTPPTPSSGEEEDRYVPAAARRCVDLAADLFRRAL
jgi:carboxymethylenebutenolidase